MKLVASFFLLTLSFLGHALTIGSYNIRNFDYDQRYRIHTNKPELSQILKEISADILSVEEINNTAVFERFIADKFPGFGVELSRCGGAGGQHVGFIYNKAKIELLSFNEDLSVTDPDGTPSCDLSSRPLAIALFQNKTTKQRFYGMTAHLKAGSEQEAQSKRQKQLEIIKALINDLKMKTGIKDYFVAGDFNTTEYLSKGPDYKMLSRFTSDLGMIDTADSIGCSAYWWGGSDDGVESPTLLDHVIVTKGLMKRKPQVKVWTHCQKVSCRKARTQELGVSYESVSDHCPVTATLE